MQADSIEPKILDWLASQEGAMVDLLARLVNIDSGTYNKRGSDEVGRAIGEFLAGHGIALETLPQERFGDCLRAAVPSGAPGGERSAHNRGNIVLMGHRDTVFPDGEASRRPFTVRDGVAYGPGVADMKAGLVMNSFVLAAFARFGGAPAPVVALYTADEEIGSPEGRPVIEAEAARARVVLNAEPGRVSGNIVTARKGGVFMAMEITGKASHSGLNFSDGISAIEELAQKIVALHKLTDLERSITLNVGLVSGGQSVNTVAPSARGEIDLRYLEPRDRGEIMGKIQEIIERSYVPGTHATLTILGEFLPLTQSEAAKSFFKIYRGAAADSGFASGEEFAGGCADSGLTAALGVPTLCAVGPSGAKPHTPEEFLNLDTLVPRAQACARTILRLDDAGL